MTNNPIMLDDGQFHPTEELIPVALPPLTSPRWHPYCYSPKYKSTTRFETEKEA